MLNDRSLIVKSIYNCNREIKIHFKKNTIFDIKDLILLYESVGWKKKSTIKLQQLIKNNLLITCFVKISILKINLIGFVIASLDYSQYAIVWDLMIHPKFQNLGLGKDLMFLLMHEIREMNINNIILFAEPQVINFYVKLGFKIEPDHNKVLFLCK
uniref:GNAT family acetyltransferase n=1 Tax=Galdieria phlegrea TaxID=1389228 RepID=UPI0023D84579|nr:GNAT family acetyltransferase [Galdieria phlegrea]WDA99802.1 GNAT family acetyltransferase [Galdieria phlegrea]